MISLELNEIKVTFSKFLDKKLPLSILAPSPTVEFSLNGTAVGAGGYFTPKYLWSINALIDQETEIKLNIIYKEFERLRTSLQDAAILLEDTNQQIQELTESLIHTPIPDTTITEIGDYSSFYAQFNVWFTQSPAYLQEGRYRTVNLTLTEI